MMVTAHVYSEPIAPTERESSLAQESGRLLSRFVSERRDLPIRVVENGKQSDPIVLPASAIQLLLDILNEMAQGNAVTLIPIHAELTTQQAADFLNVSRPFLVQLLEKKEIPFRKVGAHRRVLFKDLKEYNDRIDSQRRKVLAELAQQAQELNMGYK